NWMVEVNAKNHNDEAGKYIIHAYGTDRRGNDGLMGYSTIMVKHKDYAPPTAGGVDSSTKVCTGRYISLFADQVTDDMSGVDGVRVAVWSAENGQDDLKWYNMGMVDKSRNRWGVQVDLKNHKGGGTYYAHVYATDKAGNDGFVGNMDFTFNRDTKPPTSTAVKGILKSANSPIFTAIADNVTDPSGVRGVRFAVWTEKNGQDDLRWYDGMDGGGTPNWMVEVNAKNHNDEAGKYIIHAYGTDEWGNDGLMGYSTIMVKHKDVTPPTASGVRTSTTECNSPELSIFADNVADDWSGVKSVRAAIWSNANGQDDLQWYSLGIVDPPNNLTWGRLIHLTDFNTVGDYQIHFYGVDNAGNEKMLGNTSVTVNVDALGGYKIMGTSGVSALQLVKYYNGASGHYDWNPAEYGGMSIDQFCQSYIDICSAEGVKAEVAFAQMCLETKTLNYGNLVIRPQWNFAGLGATGNAVPPDANNPNGVDQGIYFTTVENGIKSQIQHLKAYASKDSLVLPTAPEYNRFGYVTRGCAPTVEGLSGKWATGMDYGAKVMVKVKDVLATNG
ncbi:MAG: GBS Bsp-like repeat-containing protein, partial [Christensenella sp.]